MKKKIISIILILLAIVLIIVGLVLGYDKDTEVNPPEPEEGYIGEAENYMEIGSESLKEDQVFDNIKYTQNHLSTTSNTYATFTSVIYNQTGQDLAHQHLEIDFYDASKQLLGTMDSTIEKVANGESTMIYGIIEVDLSTADSFIVRLVEEE